MADVTVRIWLADDDYKAVSYTDVDIVGEKPHSVIMTIDDAVLQTHIDDAFLHSFYSGGSLIIDTAPETTRQNINDWSYELDQVNAWFIQNNDIVIQEYLGEILNTDQVYLDYIAERAIKIARKAELEGYLGI